MIKQNRWEKVGTPCPVVVVNVGIAVVVLVDVGDFELVVVAAQLVHIGPSCCRWCH